MPTMTDVMSEVQSLFHELKSRVDTLDADNKRIAEELVSKSGQMPAEHKAAIDALNGRMDIVLDQWKEMNIAKEREKLMGYDNRNAKESEGTKAFMKALRGVKAMNAAQTFHTSMSHLTDEELSHISYKHMPEERKALYAGDATTGGFFASVDFQNSLKAYQILISPMRQVAQVIPTSGEKVEYPNLLNDTSAYYATEQGSYSQSGDPSLGMLNIPVHEMRGFLQLSQQNMEDSMFPLESFLKERLAMKFAQREGTAFIRGTGQGQPRGIMAYNGAYAASQAYNFTATPTGKQTGLTYIPYVPSGTAATLGQGDCLVLALQDLKTVYANKPSVRFCLTRTTVGTLRLIKDSQQRPLWQPFAGDNLPATIYGIPYIEMPDMDEVGANNFPIIIGDFSNYLIADRAGVNFSVRQLDELFALQGLVGFIARNRHGGDVLIPEAFRTIRCSTT